MIDPNRAFRDYATSVSFHMTLSRNQVATLRGIVVDIEMYKTTKDWFQRAEAKDAAYHETQEVNMWIVGARKLESMGLIQFDARRVEDDKHIEIAKELIAKRLRHSRPIRSYMGPTWALTQAGEHVVELLRIAGLIPMRVIQGGKRKARA